MVYIDVLLFYFAVLLLLRHFVSKGTKCRDVSIFLFTLIHSWVGIWLYTLPISLSGDVEVNPGPITKSNNWNLNIISAHNYLKVSILKAHLTIDKFDIVCLSKTCLNSNTALDNDNFEISGYNVIRSDYSCNSKHGGVCIYYKSFLHARVLDIQYLHECINIDLNIGDKLCYNIALYRSPNQSQDNLRNFLRNLN